MKKPSFASMIIIVAVATVVLLIASAVWRNNAPSDYDEVAQCITDNGGKVKVAYWCSACAAQEEMFGSAWRLIDKTECSSPGSRDFDLCPEISGTPTWEMANGTTFSGAFPVADLAETFGCTEFLP